MRKDQGSAALGLGQVYLRLGEAPAAAEAFRTALQKSPRSIEALLGLGEALQETGDTRGSRRAFEQVRAG